MSLPQEQSSAAWRQLEDEWGQKHEYWRDSTAQYFATHHWEPLEDEMDAFQRSLDRLMEVLDAAREVARAAH